MRTRVVLFVITALALAGCGGADEDRRANDLEVPIRRELYPVVAGVPVGNFAVTESACKSSGGGRYECVVEWVSGLDSTHGSATATLMCEGRSCVGHWTWGRRISLELSR